MKVRVWTVTCPRCDLEIYSRAPHDYRTCGCPAKTMIDGGFTGYFRAGARPEYFNAVNASSRYRFVNATRSELYDDWNTQRNRFGVIVNRKGAK